MRMLPKFAVLGLIGGLAGGLAAVSSAGASDDPIATRQAIMSSLGAAAGLGGGMMKGEIAYAPAAGKAAISTARAVALTFGDYFPEGSGEGQTGAAPSIWEDASGFSDNIGKLQAATAAAMDAAGKDGPADIEAFKAAFGPVLGTCKSCHETYRRKY